MTVHTSTIALRQPVAPELADEIARRLYFVSSEIKAFELVTGADGVVGVTLSTEPEVPADLLARKVNDLVDTEIRPQLPAPPKVVWTSAGRQLGRDGMFERLIELGAVDQPGDGRITLGEPVLSLFRWFDRAIVDILGRSHRWQEFRYPTLISTESLRRAGYFTSFPQHLMFATRLHNDMDVYRDFHERYGAGGIDAGILASCQDVTQCLPPTMCYHTFAQFAGRDLDDDELRVVTARGKSFRYESSYWHSLERLWDFTIREIVFLGSRDQVLDARTAFMQEIFAFVDELDLAGRCEVGNDPFFGSAATPSQIWSQRMLELKYELRLSVGGGRDIAVGSFNFHDDLFGKSFEITRRGQTVRSGCVGFGLERLVYAFLCRHGADVGDWPKQVARA